MNVARWFAIVGTLVLMVATTLAQEPPELTISAMSEDGVAEYDEATGTVSDPAGVRVQYGDANLTAREIKLERATSTVEADGSVRLQHATEIWTGEHIRYNFASGQIETQTFRTGRPPFFAAGEGLHASFTNSTHSATNGFITTDDIADPAYRVRAKQLTFVPGRYMEARGATLYLGKVPVMYFPRYRRHFDRHPNNWVFVPGYRSLYGAYLLSTYNWTIATNAAAAFHMDYRTKRGFGGGADLEYDLGKAGEGKFKSYYADDQDPGTGSNGEAIPENRYRISFVHSAYVNTNFTGRLVLNKQGDAYVLHDFFENEYRKNIMPKSFLELDQQWSNFSLDLLAQPQLNDFFQTVERLPDLRLTGLRQQLGISPVYYESDSSLGYFRNRSGDFAPSTNYAAMRGDTYHQLLIPWNLFGWLNVTPRAGGRYTYYGEEDGVTFDQDSQNRWVFNTGAEVSTKLSRVWPGTRNRTFDITGMRHIVEPSVNYVYVPTPNHRPPDLPQFDYESYSLEMPPVDFPDYNSIDSVDSQNVFRFGLRNKLQTKRRENIDNFANWGLYLDWRVHPREDQRTYGDLYSDLDFKPRSWLTFNSQLRYDINTTTWRMANHTATIKPNDIWHWKISHRYLLGIPGYGPESGNNLIISSLYYRLNDNWAVRASQHFEARNGVMQEQYYTLYRDFRSWTAALTLRLRDPEDTLNHREDWTIAFMVSLKAFPRFRLGRDQDDPSYLLGD